MAFPERRTADVLLTVLLFAAVCDHRQRQAYFINFRSCCIFSDLINPAVKFLQQHFLFLKA